jgi:hypothetical protein
MLQRNVSGSPLDMPTLDPPVSVGPGGEIDHHQLLAGFEPVGEPDEQDQEPDDRETSGDVHVPDGSEPAPGDGDVDTAAEAAASVTTTPKSGHTPATRKGASR